MIDWLIDWLSDWLSGWLSDWLSEWLSELLSDWMSDWVIELMIDWAIDGWIDWLIDGLKDRWIHLLIDFCEFNFSDGRSGLNVCSTNAKRSLPQRRKDAGLKTDGRTVRRTDGPTDRPSYKDTRTCIWKLGRNILNSRETPYRSSRENHGVIFLKSTRARNSVENTISWHFKWMRHLSEFCFVRR